MSNSFLIMMLKLVARCCSMKTTSRRSSVFPKGSTVCSGHRLWTDLSGAEIVKSKKIRVEFSLEDMDTDGYKKCET